MIKEILFPQVPAQWDYDRAVQAKKKEDRLIICGIFLSVFGGFAALLANNRLPPRMSIAKPWVIKGIQVVPTILFISTIVLGILAVCYGHKKGANEAQKVVNVFNSIFTVFTFHEIGNACYSLYLGTMLSPVWPIIYVVSSVALVALSWGSIRLSLKHVKGLSDRTFAQIAFPKIQESISSVTPQPLPYHLQVQDPVKLRIQTENLTEPEKLTLLQDAYDHGKILRFSTHEDYTENVHQNGIFSRMKNLAGKGKEISWFEKTVCAFIKIYYTMQTAREK